MKTKLVEVITRTIDTDTDTRREPIGLKVIGPMSRRTLLRMIGTDQSGNVNAHTGPNTQEAITQGVRRYLTLADGTGTGGGAKVLWAGLWQGRSLALIRKSPPAC